MTCGSPLHTVTSEPASSSRFCCLQSRFRLCERKRLLEPLVLCADAQPCNAKMTPSRLCNFAVLSPKLVSFTHVHKHGLHRPSTHRHNEARGSHRGVAVGGRPDYRRFQTPPPRYQHIRWERVLSDTSKGAHHPASAANTAHVRPGKCIGNAGYNKQSTYSSKLAGSSSDSEGNCCKVVLEAAIQQDPNALRGHRQSVVRSSRSTCCCAHQDIDETLTSCLYISFHHLLSYIACWRIACVYETTGTTKQITGTRNTFQN
jgi:hypothetical protein